MPRTLQRDGSVTAFCRGYTNICLTAAYEHRGPFARDGVHFEALLCDPIRNPFLVSLGVMSETCLSHRTR